MPHGADSLLSQQRLGACAVPRAPCPVPRARCPLCSAPPLFGPRASRRHCRWPSGTDAHPCRSACSSPCMCQIGDLDFTTGVVLDASIKVVVGDKWVPRQFVLSEKLHGLFFWVGSRSEVLGAVSKVRVRVVVHAACFVHPSRASPLGYRTRCSAAVLRVGFPVTVVTALVVLVGGGGWVVVCLGGSRLCCPFLCRSLCFLSPA
jgi:hypothetical protein